MPTLCDLWFGDGKGVGRVHGEYFKYYFSEAGRGAAARSVTVKPTGCGFDLHWRR